MSSGFAVLVAIILFMHASFAVFGHAATLI